MPDRKKTTKTKTMKKTVKKGGARQGARRTSAGSASARPARRHVHRREPESLRLRLAQPSLTVSDLAASLSWYRDVLGFTVKERWEHEGKLAGVELVAGAVSFYLSQDDWARGRDRMKGQGFRLYCTTAQDIDRLAQGIRERGGRLLEEPHDEPWGGRAFTLADPDGFKITVTT